MRIISISTLCLAALVTGGGAAAQQAAPGSVPRVQPGAFPISVQFSRVPSGHGWRDEQPPLSDELIEQTLHNIILHGCTNLSIGEFSNEGGSARILQYAQQLGMGIDFTSNGVQLFKRNAPPEYSVYSPQYIEQVRKQIEPVLGKGKRIERIHTIFPFMDEPFHADTTSFDYSAPTADQFKKQYGYPMPASYAQAKANPRAHLDFVNFQSSTFVQAWRSIYAEVKKYDQRPKLVMTHDSHSTMGGGVDSDSKYAVDDIFHWGGDYADMFLYDIYPYTMYDYRYGEHSQYPKPRISQMHYTMAQMRNLTTTYGKELGFWVGTYNEGWFRRYMNEDMRERYWGERELAYTAVANGANFLITGLKIPEDARHWDDFGRGMTILQKAGAEILSAPVVKSRACFLFPRTQYIQLQKEYFNVALTFELCMRAFGQMDIIHEEQITDEKMNGYEILVLADIELLPASVADHIVKFVENGGVVIADCVPVMDELMRQNETMKKLMGVSAASADRVVQKGTWNPMTILPAKWSYGMEAPDAPPVKIFGQAEGTAFGKQYDFRVVSPRNCKVSSGKTQLDMASGQPALITRQVGKGRTYLFGFCLQDTYFQSWKDGDVASRTGLYSLVRAVFLDSGVRSAVYSSNPDIEVTLRAGKDEVYVFVINHEAAEPMTQVTLSDLGFEVGSVMDVAYKDTSYNNVKWLDFECTESGCKFNVIAARGTPTGVTRLLKVTPKQK